MKFYFHEHAENEFDRAVEYYEDCRRGLGIEFAQEVNAAIARIIQFNFQFLWRHHTHTSGK